MNSSMIDTLDHITKVRQRLEAIVGALRNRALVHDQSKLEEPELSGYAVLADALQGLSYGTPEYRAAFAPFKAIIQHHYKANDHHPEHFANGVNDMNLLQLVEMLCDWKAASLRNSKSLNETIDKTIERFGISEQLAAIIKNTITLMDW